MKQSILSLPRPFVCALVKEDSLEKNILRMREAAFDGAQALGIHMRFMPTAEKNDEGLRRLMSCTSRPVMAIHYRDGVDKSLTDEDRADILLRSAKAGASMIDVMGDLYEPSQFELATSDAAVAKQVKTIEEVHRRGAKVVMSSHVLDRARTADEVIAHLREQEKRGADICKHVSMVNTADEFQESVKTLCRLRAEFKKPWIVLGSGAYGRMQRFLGPQFGCAVEFAVHDYEPGDPYDQQPTIRAFKSALDAICWRAPA